MSFERTADADDVVHVAAPRRQGLIELFFNFVQTATSPSAKVRVVGSNEYDGQEYTLAALDQEAIIPELEFLQHVIFLGDTSGLPRQLITSSVSWLRLAMVA